jgi:hypothetical protein
MYFQLFSAKWFASNLDMRKPKSSGHMRRAKYSDQFEVGSTLLICAVLLRLLRSGNQEPPEEVEFTLVIAGARMQGVVYRRNSPRRFVRRRQRAPSERQESS